MPKTLPAANPLRERSAQAIVRAIADAAERWHDADFPPRVRAQAAIEARTGYTIPVIEYALDRLFGSLRAAALCDAVEAEVGSLEALDGPVERHDRRAYARGVDEVVIVGSNTTIGVALVPAVYALIAKCRVVVKDRDDHLIGAFFETLIQEDPAFTDAAIAEVWHGGNDPREATLFAGAQTIVVFGSDATIEAVRLGASTATRIVAFGHRASAGYIRGIDLAGDTAELAGRVARDALLYDGSGCMSLHVLFVESDEPAAARDFARVLGAALERVAIEFPPGRLAAGRAASHAAARDLAVFRAASGVGTVISAPSAQATLIVDPPRDAPPPLAARIVPIFTVTSPAEAADYLRAQHLPLEALALADPDHYSALAEVVVAGGAVRITRFGEMQSPPADAHHGGEPCIMPFIRWIDVER